MNDLIFSQSPVIEICTNKFINVPTILKYDDTPLIEVIKVAQAGYTTRFSIFHNDGTKLAKVKGSQLYLTNAGKKAGVTLRHPDKMTICEINGSVAFEIYREDTASLKTQAELFTPDGAFIKCRDKSALNLLDPNGIQLNIGGFTMMNVTISNCRVGIHLRSSSLSSI